MQKVAKLAAFLDDAEPDVVSYTTFPTEHRAKLHLTNPIERFNGDIKQRTDVSSSSRTTTPSSVSSAHSCSNRTMNGPARPLHDAGKRRPVEQ
jgi:putative transposase